MTLKLILATLILVVSEPALAGSLKLNTEKSSGTFSLGTRNTISMFNDDEAIGKGIGGQFRLQFSERLNSEWFADFITSKNGHYTFRNDYHIGWSLMYYFGTNAHFEKLLQPYFIAGHCFDYSLVKEQRNETNSANRLSMATQAGAGTHLNISKRFDCSLSVQYMIHFGKEIETNITDEGITIERKNFSSPDGHLLVSLSFNYKLASLW